MTKPYDLAVVGAGIVGLAHAWAAARLGKRVVVIDRDSAANGASIRNFGFITVTGQERGTTWRRARRSRDLWARLSREAGIAIEHEGLILTLRHPQSLDVVAALLATEMGEGCDLWRRADLERRAPELCATASLGALFSPHELRVESRLAIPRLAAWLGEVHGVEFRYGTAVLTVAPPLIETSRGPIAANAAVVAPGDDLTSLFPDVIAARGVGRCALTMLRLADSGFRLPAAVMSDLGLIRYLGYSDLPEAAPLRALLTRTAAESLAHGVHLIAVQSADGSLIVGDSHHYGEGAAPFMAARTEVLILEEFAEATGRTPPPVIERWTGTYATAPEGPMFVEAPARDVRLVMITGGTGASTAFAIAEEVIDDLFGSNLETLPMTKLAAVVFDWAGTMIDFGCMAPVRALTEAFAAEGVTLNEADARRDMGLAKCAHVRALMKHGPVAEAWRSAHGAVPVESDGDRLYAALEPLMIAAAAASSDLIPGAAPLAAALSRGGVKIGSCTGYTRAMMAPILAAAAAQGYAPASVICAGETPSGRPSPLMMWQALIVLDAWPAWRCVKVDDAEVGIAEGRAAGAWTVGVSASGNGVGLGLAALGALPAVERARRISASTAALKAAGADYVVETVADLAPVLAEIEARVTQGDRPG